MKVDIYLYDIVVLPKDSMRPDCPVIDHRLYPLPIGYVEVEKFNAQEIFHLCNWVHWMNEKPVNLHSKIKSCGHGLMLIDPNTQKRYLAKSFGWLVGTEETINKYVANNRYRAYWK